MTLPADNDALMKPEAAAAYMDFSIHTLSTWRATKRHPLKYYKIGREVRYRKSDLDAFLASQLQSGEVLQ